MASTIVPFVRQSLKVNNTILEIFNDKLGLPAGSLLERHLMEEYSGSEARITKNGPTTNTTKVAIGSHTDFGSLVINWSFIHISLAYFSGFTLVFPSQPIGRAPGAPARFGIMAICQGLLLCLKFNRTFDILLLAYPTPRYLQRWGCSSFV